VRSTVRRDGDSGAGRFTPDGHRPLLAGSAHPAPPHEMDDDVRVEEQKSRHDAHENSSSASISSSSASSPGNCPKYRADTGPRALWAAQRSLVQRTEKRHGYAAPKSEILVAGRLDGFGIDPEERS
jgi:hypothetical protein